MKQKGVFKAFEIDKHAVAPKKRLGNLPHPLPLLPLLLWKNKMVILVTATSTAYNVSVNSSHAWPMMLIHR